MLHQRHVILIANFLRQFYRLHLHQRGCRKIPRFGVAHRQRVESRRLLAIGNVDGFFRQQIGDGDIASAYADVGFIYEL